MPEEKLTKSRFSLRKANTLFAKYLTIAGLAIAALAHAPFLRPVGPGVAAPATAKTALAQTDGSDADEDTLFPDVGNPYGILGIVQDWLARANREYQGIVIRQLSLPPSDETPEDAISGKRDAELAKAARDAARRKAAERKAARQARDAQRVARERKDAAGHTAARETRQAEAAKSNSDTGKAAADMPTTAPTKPAPPTGPGIKDELPHGTVTAARASPGTSVGLPRYVAQALKSHSGHRERMIIVRPEPIPRPATARAPRAMRQPAPYVIYRGDSL